MARIFDLYVRSRERALNDFSRRQALERRSRFFFFSLRSRRNLEWRSRRRDSFLRHFFLRSRSFFRILLFFSPLIFFNLLSTARRLETQYFLLRSAALLRIRAQRRLDFLTLRSRLDFLPRRSFMYLRRRIAARFLAR